MICIFLLNKVILQKKICSPNLTKGVHFSVSIAFGFPPNLMRSFIISSLSSMQHCKKRKINTISTSRNEMGKECLLCYYKYCKLLPKFTQSLAKHTSKAMILNRGPLGSVGGAAKYGLYCHFVFHYLVLLRMPHIVI